MNNDRKMQEERGERDKIERISYNKEQEVNRRKREVRK